MDITVSIADHRSLSTSELIRQRLYSSIQIGNTCHSGSGLLIRGAKFRSGTVENPLILTVKNSQTETVMYVRNVPISAVLEQNGFSEQWIAVYPPGDPQNYQQFDPGTMPPQSCPQVCVSIAVQEEEDSAGVSHLAFDPQPRLSAGAVGGSSMPWQASAAQEGQRQSWAPPSVLPPTSTATAADVSAGAGAGAGAGVSLDGSFRLKAQRLKEHVAEVANAAKRAQDVTRTLQESLRIRDDLRHQLRGLEEELASQHSATSGLQREIGQLHAEEAQLKEQISQRNSVFQELRESRDSIDRELSRVLGEGDRQRSQIEASSKDFGQQRQSMAGEIEQSKHHVSQLMTTLKQREEVVAESQRKAREGLQAAISKARADLAGARASLDEQQKACGRLDSRRTEAMEQLQRLQGGASAQEGSPQKGQADAKADLENRRGKIDVQLARARNLEQELNENRSQLERMSARVAELHTEAREKELMVQRCEDARLELERQLAERRSSGASLQEQLRASGGQLARADQEAERAREALDMVEGAGQLQALQALENQPPEDEQLELAIRGGRERLASMQSELSAMRGACEGLEATTRSSKLLARDRKSALEAARGRASELARRLEAAAAASSTDSSDVLRRLAQDITACDSRLLEAQRHALQREEEVQQLLVLQREAALEAGEGAEAGEAGEAREAGETRPRGGRAARLEVVAAELRREVECLEEAKRLAKMQHLELEGDLAANQLSLTDLQAEIDSLMSESRSSEEELARMVQHNETLTSRLSSGYDKLAELEEVSCVQKADLEQSRATLLAKLQKVEEMEQAHKREVEELERREASLASERAEAERAGVQLQAQISELELDSSQLDGVLTSHRQRQQELQSSLEQTLALQASANAERKDQLSQTESRVNEAATATRSSMECRERALGRLQATETARKAARSRLTTVREEAEDEVGKAAVARSHLEGRHESLVSLHSELEEHQSQASQMERLRAKLALESEEYLARIERARRATEEVYRLEERLRELQEQRRAEELRQRDQEREVREQLQRRDAGALHRREEEIGRHQQQIGKLEAEQRELQQQAGRLEAERRALEQGLAERGRERQDAQEAYRCEAQTCERLETAAQETRSLAQRLEQREVLRRAVLELEESLQRLGDDLEEEQELVRRERAEEEELRLDIQKLKESITSTDDKALYQGEHGNLQFETIQKLEEQKKNGPGGESSGTAGAFRMIACLKCGTGLDSMLSIVESNQFRELTHLALRLRQGTDEVVKQHLALKLRSCRSERAELAQGLRASEEALCRAKKQAEELGTRAQTLAEERQQLEHSLEARHEREVAVLRQEHAEAVTELQRRASEERSRIEVELRRSLDEATGRAARAERAGEELQQQRQVLQASGKNCQERLELAEAQLGEARQDVLLLREQVKQLELLKFQHEREIGELKVQLAGSRDQFALKEQLVTNQMAQLEEASRQRKGLEEMLASVRQQAQALEEKFALSAQEIQKGNQIIQSLHANRKQARVKLKLKSSALVQQEKTVLELEKAEELSKHLLEEKEGELARAREREERLREELEQLKRKLQEAKEQLQSDQDAIDYLNRQLTERDLNALPAPSVPSAATAPKDARSSPLEELLRRAESAGKALGGVGRFAAVPGPTGPGGLGGVGSPGSQAGALGGVTADLQGIEALAAPAGMPSLAGTHSHLGSGSGSGFGLGPAGSGTSSSGLGDFVRSSAFAGSMLGGSGAIGKLKSSPATAFGHVGAAGLGVAPGSLQGAVAYRKPGLTTGPQELLAR